MENINGSLISDITNFLKTISDIVFKAFDKLNDLGVLTEDMKESSDGTLTWRFVSKDKKHKIECVATPIESTDNLKHYDIVYKSEDGKKYTAKDVSEKELYDAFEEAIEALYDTEIEQWVEASIKVGLKRIVGTDEDLVELCGVFADTTVQNINDALNGILVEDFAVTIPEEETWYAITDCGDEYDVNQCEAVAPDPAQSLLECLSQAFQCLSTFQVVHWNAVGKDFFTLHEKLDEYIETIQFNIDELAEMYKQMHKVIPSPATFYKSGKIIETNSETGFDITSGFGVVRDVIVVYCMTLECYYCNLPSDMQSKFDEFLSYWNKESQYKLDSLLGA